ncbi:hypothetical protein OEA41_001676 [Lepraria neglecta]|uniref:Uncharacterized protein n=1 Tax=Lepraria neglecta TaxID=209136 RepID=A0AAD9ZA64_9LECA|nr:hypothetical protein OEA41_001676 [Lepraria neglecta]
MVEPDGHHKDNAEQGHAIIHITLKNSETYAVDITGAQYGHYDSVIPWDLYAESQVDSIQEVQPLGSIKECRKRMDKATKTDGCTKTIEEEIAESLCCSCDVLAGCNWTAERYAEAPRGSLCEEAGRPVKFYR